MIPTPKSEGSDLAHRLGRRGPDVNIFRTTLKDDQHQERITLSESEFPPPSGRGYDEFFVLFFEGGVNVDFKHSNAIIIIETALTQPPIK